MKFFFIIILLFSNVALTKDNGNKILKYSLIQYEQPINFKEITYFDLEDKPLTLEEYNGNITIIHFWATWCTFCINNIKELDNLYKKLKSEKKEQTINIITLSEDYKDPNIIKNFFSQKNIEFLEPYVDKKNTIFNNLKITSIPSTIILNKEGKEVVRINGFIDWGKDKDFLEILAKYQ